MHYCSYGLNILYGTHLPTTKQNTYVKLDNIRREKRRENNKKLNKERSVSNKIKKCGGFLGFDDLAANKLLKTHKINANTRNKSQKNQKNLIALLNY